jgi:hypothetical protein
MGPKAKKTAPVKKGGKKKGAKKGAEHHDDLEAEEEKVNHPAAELIPAMAAVKVSLPPPFQQALGFTATEMKAARGKEGEKGKIPYFDNHDLINAEHFRKANISSKRHLFIADQTGKLGTMYEYAANTRMISAHGEIKKCIIAKTQSKEEGAANLRKDILSCMRRGE